MSANTSLNPNSSTLRILVVRPDRIGDVVLSTPVFEVLKRHYPRSHLTVMVRAPLVPLVKKLPSVDEVMVYDPDGAHAGLKGFLTLMREVRDRHFRIAVVLHSYWKIAAALFGAGVRYRVGPLSKPHSFLFYNRGVRQRRSQVEMHEADYNLQLLRRLGIRVGTRNVPIRISVSEKSLQWARQWLEEKGWKPPRKLVVIHPGMGGSALNWPENHYVDLARALANEGHFVLISTGPDDGPLLTRLQDALGSVKDGLVFYDQGEKGTLEQLCAVYHFADVVIAPSTGPLHLAVALSKRVVTFYPPIRVQSALRWGPYLSDELRASVLVPEVYCGQEFECLGNLCNYYPCMKGLTVTQALEQVHWQLSRTEEKAHEL